MNALTHAEPTTAQTLDETVFRTAADLRSFVRGLQRPRLADRAWLQSVRDRCHDLSERFGHLKSRAGKPTQARLHEIREALVRFSGELGDRPSVQRLGQMSSALSRHYEDLVAHLAEQSALAKAAEELRPIRLIRPWRTATHIGLGLACFLLYQFVFDHTTALTLLAIFGAVFGGLEISRRFSKRWNDFMVDRLFALIARPRERYTTNSATYYLIGLTVACWIAPKEGVLAAILILALADPVASLVGSRWGKRKLHQDKSVVGSAAFYLTALLVSFVYLAIVGAAALPVALGIAALMALAGTLAEVFGGHVDDNFSIPVACALVGALLL